MSIYIIILMTHESNNYRLVYRMIKTREISSQQLPPHEAIDTNPGQTLG